MAGIASGGWAGYSGGGGGGVMGGYDPQRMASDMRNAANATNAAAAGGGGGSLKEQSFAAYQRGEKNLPGGLGYQQYVDKYFGGGGGGAQQAAGGGDLAARVSAGYQKSKAMGSVGGGGGGVGASGSFMDKLGGAGAGLLDPSSAYSQRMREEIQEGIGQNTAAQQRGAALRAARSGLGAGASPELMEMQGEIGREGQRAAGAADASAVLGAQQLGGGMLSAAMGGDITLQGQKLQGFLSNEQLNANQQLQNQSLQHQSQLQQQQLQTQADLQNQALQQEAMLRELSMGYGG